jgi:hypothetical protein
MPPVEPGRRREAANDEVGPGRRGRVVWQWRGNDRFWNGRWVGGSVGRVFQIKDFLVSPPEFKIT